MFSTMNFKRKITRVFLLENFGSYWAGGSLRASQISRAGLYSTVVTEQS